MIENELQTENSTIKRDFERIKLEFVTTDTTLEKIAMGTGYPLNALEAISIEDNWDSERKAYKARINNEMDSRVQDAKRKATMNTIVRSSVLQKKVYDEIEKGIADGTYQPTISEFIKLSQTIESIGKKDVSNVGVMGDNNKIINITLEKPLENHSLEELVEIEQKVRNGQ